jgi:hypothetical protein
MTAVKISGSGIARNGRAAIKRRREMWMASDAISCLHDALLAVAKGDITPDQVRAFFWPGDDLDRAEFIGGVISFEGEKAAAPTSPESGTVRARASDEALPPACDGAERRA